MSSIEFPFQKHAKKNQRTMTSYNLELESPLFHITAVKWLLGLLSWGCSLTQPTVESNFNHWRWTFWILPAPTICWFSANICSFPSWRVIICCLLQSFTLFLNFQEKVLWSHLHCDPAIVEFIEGILNMTLVKFNIISNQFVKVLERKS